MPMHECFSGLFSELPPKGVARVSGVISSELGNKSSVMLALDKQNTPHSTGGVCVAIDIVENQSTRERETPATPETPPAHYTREDFSNHTHRFCAMPCPAMFSDARWAQIQTDAKSFFDLWGSQVAALGWNPDVVFSIPDGLIFLIEGGDILAVCEKTAVVRARSRKQFNTIRFKALSGETTPKWRIWDSWCEP